MSGNARDDEFFVGYLPTPSGLRRFHARTVAGVVVAVLAIAWGLATSASGEHGRFGGGEADFVGVLSASPVPTLRVIDPMREGGVRTLLVVRGGKNGFPAAQARELDGQVVHLRGGLVERDGHGMIEVYQPVEPGELSLAERAVIDQRPRTELGLVHLVGELVDSKCWLGRMHPGAGRTHRACAQQCVAGGIPALLVARASDGSETPYVLADVADDATAEAILEMLADPVALDGELVRDGDLLVVAVEPGSLRRR